MSARLAHEINNPASAAARSVDVVAATTCDTMLSSLVRLAELSLSSEQFVAIDALRREVDGAAAVRRPDCGGGSRGGAGRLAGRHDVGERVADRAARSPSRGSTSRGASAPPQILDGDPRAGPRVGRRHASTSRTLLAEMRSRRGGSPSSSARCKSYSQMDRAVDADGVDVTEGIESTLVMLEHKLDGVSVVRSYAADAPRVYASPGDLNQVWTNLIDNAIDAMDGTGTLRTHHPCRTREASWSRWATRALACRRTCRAAPSSRGSPRRTSARARGSASTSRTRSCATCTTARSRSTRRRGER